MAGWETTHNGPRSVGAILHSHAEKGGAVDVRVAVLADYANVSQDGKLNIMGIFQEINPSFLPFPMLKCTWSCRFRRGRRVRYR